MRDGGDAVRLIADVDKDFGARNLENTTLNHLMPSGRREVAVILKKVLIFFGIDEILVTRRGIEFLVRRVRNRWPTGHPTGQVIVCQSLILP
jgi:hypothetical protein